MRDETYDTLAYERLEHGISYALAIRRLIYETYDSLVLRRLGPILPHHSNN